MKVTEIFLKGCYIIEPDVFKDERGFFFESFNYEKFKKKTGIDVNFVQDNISKSKKGVIRGLHIQKKPYDQAKLVYVIYGKVLDVVIDVRKGSPSYGEHFSIELSKENNIHLYIPRGFLHGFSALEDDTVFVYKCDNYYNKEFEDGVIYNDPKLNINWKLKREDIILSKKDKKLNSFSKFKV